VVSISTVLASLLFFLYIVGNIVKYFQLLKVGGILIVDVLVCCVASVDFFCVNLALPLVWS
jgi:hypothetical protein